MSTIILATEGEYSDYSVNGIFNVLKPFVLANVIKELTAVVDGKPRPSDLITYLVQGGYIEVADYGGIAPWRLRHD